MQRKFPSSSTELIDALDRMIPELAPGRSDSLDEIKYDAGRRSVVLMLKQWMTASHTAPDKPEQRNRDHRVRGKNP